MCMQICNKYICIHTNIHTGIYIVPYIYISICQSVGMASGSGRIPLAVVIRQQQADMIGILRITAL